MTYAILNDKNICVSTITYFTPVKDIPDNYIGITENQDVQYKKFESGQWSMERYEPTTTAPLNEFEQLKAKNQQLEQQLAQTNSDLASLMEFVTNI